MEQGAPSTFIPWVCHALALWSSLYRPCSVWTLLPAGFAHLSPLPQQNLNGVMVAVAELLSMKIPNSYEVLFPDGPARAGLEPKKGEAEGSGK